MSCISRPTPGLPSCGRCPSCVSFVIFSHFGLLSAVADVSHKPVAHQPQSLVASTVTDSTSQCSHCEGRHDHLAFPHSGHVELLVTSPSQVDALHQPCSKPLSSHPDLTPSLCQAGRDGPLLLQDGRGRSPAVLCSQLAVGNQQHSSLGTQLPCTFSTRGWLSLRSRLAMT